MKLEPLMYEDDDGQPVVRTARINHATGKGFLVVRLIAAEEHLHAATAFARLFAAAPDLLAALEAMLKLWDDNNPDEPCACMARAPDDMTEPGPCELCFARAAIAKAKGGE